MPERRTAARHPILALLSFAVMATGAMGQAPATQDPPTTPPLLSVLGATPDSFYDSLFVPQTRGFLGADGAASIPLNPHRVLWVFGDTILGTQRNGKREGTIVRNTIAIQTLVPGQPGTVSYHWDLTDRIPGAFFHPKSFTDPHWYWPGTGVTIHGKTYLFMSHLKKGEGPAGFSFQIIGCTLFRIDNPSAPPEQWKMTHTNLGYGNDHFNINAASLVEGDNLYLIGYDDGPGKKPHDRVAILCRIPVDRLDSDKPGAALQFWSKGGKWLPNPDHVATLFRPGQTETSLQYNPTVHRYITVTIRSFGNPDLCILSAKKLTGPWTKPQNVYTIPDLAKNKLYVAYASRSHPELARNPNDLVITYVVNTSDFWSMFTAMDIYYPRFVRVRLGGGGEDGTK